MSNQIERRYTQEFRVTKDSGSPKIVGYASVFGVRSEDMGGWVEVIAPTAFDATLASKPDVRALFNHDPNMVLGRTTAGTLKLGKDAKGLTYEITPPDTSVARDLVVNMENGNINQSSFGFMCQDASWDYDEVNGVDVRTVKQVVLVDVSPVTYPAYTQANSGVRSMPADMPVEVRSKLSKRDSKQDPNDNGCACNCESCQNDECESCSSKTCEDPICKAMHGRSAKPKSEDPTAINKEGCSCTCPQCVADSCDICSDDACVDEMCSCTQNRSLHLRIAIASRLAE